jgi:glutathione S-transferase
LNGGDDACLRFVASMILSSFVLEVGDADGRWQIFFKNDLNVGADFDVAVLYVPALQLADDPRDVLTETIVVGSYLADQHAASGLIPARGTLERARFDQLLTFTATEIAQKHIPLMRKLLTEEGTAWMRAKLVAAYTLLDQRLADGRAFLTGDAFTVADAYVWGTMWQERSGAKIDHLENLMAYIARIDARPAAQKAMKDEAEAAARHEALKLAA